MLCCVELCNERSRRGKTVINVLYRRKKKEEEKKGEKNKEKFSALSRLLIGDSRSVSGRLPSNDHFNNDMSLLRNG